LLRLFLIYSQRIVRQDILAAKPEDELLFRVKSIYHRLEHIAAIFDQAMSTLRSAPESIHDQSQRNLEHLKDNSYRHSSNYRYHYP
jgi:hypothetical protein